MISSSPRGEGTRSRRDRHHIVVVDIKTGYREVRAWSFWLFDDRDRASFIVKLDDPEPFGILDRVREDRRAAIVLDRSLRQPRQIMTEENVVAENHHTQSSFPMNCRATTNACASPRGRSWTA